MKMIWKFGWEAQYYGPVKSFDMPAGAIVRRVGMDPDPANRGGLALWVEFVSGPDIVRVRREFVLQVTGAPWPETERYVGTVVRSDGVVIHVTERPTS
jgi:hypothetical protein